MFLSYCKKQSFEFTSHQVKRDIPLHAQILVKVGEEVRPEKIIAIGRKIVGFRRIELAKPLGVKPAEVEQYVMKVVGSYVMEGEVLAEVSKFGGFKKKQITSPIKGVIRAIDTKQGMMTLDYEPEDQKVVAGVTGEIESIDPEDGTIMIKTYVLDVSGIFGFGKPRDGSLHIVAQPDLPLTEKMVDSSWAGKIIVGGSNISKRVLFHCIALKVQGVVVGGMHWEDYASLMSTRSRFEDVGISLIVTEGFGNLAMDRDLYDHVHELDARFSFITGSSAQLMIPVDREKEATSHVQDTQRDSHYCTLEVGAKVRLRTLIARGEFGIIKKLKQDELLPSGIQLDSVEVELASGATIVVPTTSVEVIPSNIT